MIGIDALVDAVFRQTEVQHWRRRDGHFRRDLGVRLEKFEVLQHRMIGERDLAHDAQALRLGLHATELDPLLGLKNFDAVEHAEKIEVPPGPAEFTVRCELKPELLLLFDHLFDLAVLDRLEIRLRDRALFALGPRVFQRRRTQEAADMIGAERRFGPLHGTGSLGNLARAKARQPRQRQPQNGGQIVSHRVGCVPSWRWRCGTISVCPCGVSRRL